MFTNIINQIDSTNVRQSFPKSLLLDSEYARKDYFHNYKMSHAKLENALKLVWRATRNSSEQQVVNLIGPSGVGKTTLIEKLETEILTAEKNNMLNNPGMIPVILVEAGVPERGSFDWKQNLYWDILKKLNQEFVNEYSRRSRQPSTQLVSEAVRESIIHRGTKYLIIDEAQHIGIGASTDEKRANHMDVLKSITNRTGCNIILAGTYQYKNLLNLNEQLSRRSINVHLERYRLSSPEDIREFLNILLDFQTEMPIPEMPRLLDYAQELYEACLGCVGILKPILYSALADAIDSNANTVTLDNIRPYVTTLKQRTKMVEEIHAGEFQMEDSDEDIQSLKNFLELDKYIFSSNSASAAPSKRTSKARESRVSTKERKTTSRKPGQRSPQRDRVENGDVKYVRR